jgi:hypothetical protein
MDNNSPTSVPSPLSSLYNSPSPSASFYSSGYQRNASPIYRPSSLQFDPGQTSFHDSHTRVKTPVFDEFLTPPPSSLSYVPVNNPSLSVHSYMNVSFQETANNSPTITPSSFNHHHQHHHSTTYPYWMYYYWCIVYFYFFRLTVIFIWASLCNWFDSRLYICIHFVHCGLFVVPIFCSNIFHPCFVLIFNCHSRMVVICKVLYILSCIVWLYLYIYIFVVYSLCGQWLNSVFFFLRLSISFLFGILWFLCEWFLLLLVFNEQ